MSDVRIVHRCSLCGSSASSDTELSQLCRCNNPSHLVTSFRVLTLLVLTAEPILYMYAQLPN